MESPMKKKQAPKGMLIGAIDIGSSAIRMTLTEQTADASLQSLENVQQDIALGRDVFTTGRIEPETMQEAVEILRKYKQILQMYGLISTFKLRVMATSAVREAENKEAFIDRIFVATGFDVEVYSDSDINRIIYMGLIQTLAKHKQLKKGELLAVEIGGGITSYLGFDQGNIKFAKNSRLGLLRLAQQIVPTSQNDAKYKRFLSDQIDASLEGIKSIKFNSPRPKILLLGGDARFAASVLCKTWESEGYAKIKLKDLEHFTNHLFELDEQEIMQRYKISYFMTQTWAIALLAYCRIAGKFNAKEIHVSNNSTRDGMIAEVLGASQGATQFSQQMRLSAIELGRKYFFNEKHARTVAHYAVSIFEFLNRQHGLGMEDKVMLEIAGFLHDIGVYVSPQNHHIHSKYLIEHSDLFGLSEKNVRMVALIARYHRKELFIQNNEELTYLSKEDRIALLKLSAIIRIADALDRSHQNRLGAQIKFQILGDIFQIVPSKRVQDVSLEHFSLQMKGNLFEDVFGLKCQLLPNP